jgi:hypothetical protein
MAVTVTTKGTTQVKKVVVGRPIRRINTDAGSIKNLGGLDLSDAEDGSVLVYNETNDEWVAKKTLDNTNVNGGQY